MTATLLHLRRSVLGTAGQVTLLTGLLSGTQGLAAILTAGWLGAHDRGIVVLAATISSLMLLVAGLGLNSVARMLLADADSRIGIRLFQSRALQLVAIEALPLALVGGAIFGGVTGLREPVTLGVFGLHCVAMTLGAILRETLHGIGRHRVAVATDLAAAAVLLGGSALLHAQGRLSVLAVLILMLAGALTQCVVGLAVGRRGDAGHDRAGSLPLRRLLGLGVAGMGLGVGQWVVWRGDRLILGLVAGPEPVGVYGFISTLADIPWVIPAAVAAVVTRRVGQGLPPDELARTRRRVTILAVSLSALIAGVAIPLIPIFPGGSYPAGIPALLILVPATAALAIAQIDLAACVGYGELTAGARATMVAAGCMVILGPPLAWAWGPTGCAAASLVTYTIMAIRARAALRARLALTTSTAPAGTEAPHPAEDQRQDSRDTH